MNTLTSDISSSANKQALLNVLMYLDYSASDGSTLGQIVNDIGKDINSKSSDEIRQYTVLKNALEKNPDMNNLVIGNQSCNMGYDTIGLNTCTFTDPETGDVSVVFRGTGKGEWLDNGYGLSGTITDSQQQQQALDYFNRIVEENGYNDSNTNITISGHSKGGNKSQYVTINSEYNYLIDKCFNFDGQGMSPEAIEQFKQRNGEISYQQATEKMYGFYSENDFVNPLGPYVVPEDQRFYFENTLVDGVDDLTKHHFADGYLTLDGEFSTQVEQGNLSKVVERFSDEIVALPPEIRSVVTDSIMALMQGDNKTVDGSTISGVRIAGGLIISVPVLLVDLLGSPDGLITLFEISELGLNTIKEEYGTLAEVGVLIAAAAIIVWAAPVLLKAIGVAALINVCEVIAEKLIEFSRTIGNGLVSLANTFVEAIKTLGEWYNSNFNSGYKYASANPTILVDTYKLRSYATRLNSVNRRVSSLDSRLNSLYRRVCDFEDLISTANALWNLLQADALTSYSLRLKKCSSYLDETADDFEKTEKNIVNKAIYKR